MLHKIEIKKGFYASGKLEHIGYYIQGTGILHRNVNKPSFYCFREVNGTLVYEQYIKNGKFHRETGPAVISYDELGNITGTSYAWKDKFLSQEEWEYHLIDKERLKKLRMVK